MIPIYRQIAQRLNYIWRLFATAFCFTIFGLGGITIPHIASYWIRLTTKTPVERQRKARLLIHRSFRFYIHLMRSVGVLTWTIKGEELLKRPGLLVLANHPCLVDVVFLIAFIPNPDCIVKGKLLANPAMRGYLRLTGFLSNDSGPELIEEAQHSLATGSALIVFPEGTRTIPGEPLHFQRGAAHLALRTHTNITPVTILCQPITLTKKHSWYHIPSKKFHMTLSVGEDISIAAYDQSPTVAARRLTQHLKNYFTEELRKHDTHR